jgi:hypothetical protein
LTNPSAVGARDPIVLIFDAPIVTTTLELVLYPQVDYIVEWSHHGEAPPGAVGYERATISHNPFSPRTNYVLGVVGGESVDGAPVRMTFWGFNVGGTGIELPMIFFLYRSQ